MEKAANLCWEGLTLKHVSHPKIVKPYILFIFSALLVELFLIALFGVSGFIFYQNSFSPDIVYYICGAVLLLMFVITISVLKAIISRWNIF
ncbi:hypothetical protein BABA_02737 [Neobacillus bataviensis LMG 21833]|uniref:Uncharacterized protein n=1 Tax=Neobacillus bataviensis LMG 21833 TaxID=1117379 RepID=K6ECA4_9BACI|nr:hypothetical protein BABA_02737 [Neobacillus bataviensis LMG 21833]